MSVGFIACLMVMSNGCVIRGSIGSGVGGIVVVMDWNINMSIIALAKVNEALVDFISATLGEEAWGFAIVVAKVGINILEITSASVHVAWINNLHWVSVSQSKAISTAFKIAFGCNVVKGLWGLEGEIVVQLVKIVFLWSVSVWVGLISFCVPCI